MGLFMLGSHCRAIRYEHHDWPFVADRGIFVYFSGGGAASLTLSLLASGTLGWHFSKAPKLLDVPSLSVDR